jgi:hypothetical protein
MAKAGDCFWLETNYDGNGYIAGHLFVIILDPEEYTKNTIVVPVNTLRSQKQDQTTLLKPGDHEFIKDLSFINYSFAKVRSVTFIEQLIRDGKAKTRDPINGSVLEKILIGIRKSDHTPQEVVTMYGYYIMRKVSK